MDKELVRKYLHTTLFDLKDTVSLPSINTLEHVLYMSCGVTVISIFSQLLGFYTFLSWHGCLLCTLLLVAVAYRERSQTDVLLRMYSTAKLSAEKVYSGAKNSSAFKDVRRSNSSTETVGDAPSELPGFRDIE